MHSTIDCPDCGFPLAHDLSLSDRDRYTCRSCGTDHYE
jgi:transposase-like protein